MIDINDPKYFCVQDGKKRRLRVTNISGKDEGLYKCKVQNKVTSGKLYVARKFKTGIAVNLGGIVFVFGKEIAIK